MIDQGELFEVPSPCKRICELNNRGYCKGCFRNRDERLHWNQFTPFQKQLIVNLCEKRRLKVLAAKLAQPHPIEPEIELPIPQLELKLDEAPENTDQATQEASIKKPLEKLTPSPRTDTSAPEDQIELF